MIARLDQGGDTDGDANCRTRFPLVSVIIVNYNYGRYLKQAVRSVFAQTYARFECIIVDNASTDGSWRIIQDLTTLYADIRVLHRAANEGQSAASRDGFSMSRGEYVVFLDADDYLLPRSLQTHIAVHLASRIHVGFTSVDMLQVLHDQVVLSTGEAISTYVNVDTDARRALLRYPGTALDLELYRDLALDRKVYLVPPSWTDWVWSPTSGNCFRRDALNLFLDNPRLSDLRTQTDLYLTIGISALCGSILIDEPLFGYRLHGGNAFSARPQLNGLLSFDPVRTEENGKLAKTLLIDHLVANLERFVQEQWMRNRFMEMLKRLDIANIDAPRPLWQRRSRLASRLVAHADQIVRWVGAANAADMMRQAKVPSWTIWKITKPGSNRLR